MAIKFLYMLHRPKTAEFTNSIDPYEAADYEPPHQDLHCFSSTLWTLKQLDYLLILILNFFGQYIIARVVNIGQ